MRRLDRAQLANEFPITVYYFLRSTEASFEVSIMGKNDNIVLGEMYVRFDCMRTSLYGALKGLERVLRVCCFITSVGNGLREYSPILVFAGPCPICCAIVSSARAAILEATYA